MQPSVARRRAQEAAGGRSEKTGGCRRAVEAVAAPLPHPLQAAAGSDTDKPVQLCQSKLVCIRCSQCKGAAACTARTCAGSAPATSACSASLVCCSERLRRSISSSSTCRAGACRGRARQGWQAPPPLGAPGDRDGRRQWRRRRRRAAGGTHLPQVGLCGALAAAAGRQRPRATTRPAAGCWAAGLRRPGGADRSSAARLHAARPQSRDQGHQLAAGEVGRRLGLPTCCCSACCKRDQL